MKRVFYSAVLVLSLTCTVFVSCTPEKLDQNNEQQIDKEEITDDDI